MLSVLRHHNWEQRLLWTSQHFCTKLRNNSCRTYIDHERSDGTWLERSHSSLETSYNICPRCRSYSTRSERPSNVCPGTYTTCRESSYNVCPGCKTYGTCLNKRPHNVCPKCRSYSTCLERPTHNVISKCRSYTTCLESPYSVIPKCRSYSTCLERPYKIILKCRSYTTCLERSNNVIPKCRSYTTCSDISYSTCIGRRTYSTCPAGMKVTICGAAGCTGQPLALLLKQCPLLDEIALYDVCPTCGYGMELSHVDTKCKVSSYSGRHMLCDALRGSKVVIIVARNEFDTFEHSAPILTEITLQICNTCPNAFTIVATEPVESMVPLVGEIQRLRSVYNPRTLLGCVELNCVRANTALADFLRSPPEAVRVPVIGGATPATMVPVLSAAVHPCTMSQEQIECVTSCIMSGTEAVCAAKGGCAETPCLAGAYAVARTAINVVKGLQGGKNIVQCAYVDSLGECAPCCQFFASEVILGPSGVEKNLGVPELSKFENCLLCNCLPYVQNEIARAIWLVYTMCQQCCCASCYAHPGTCYSPPVVPCVPPTNWTCDCPDACRDEYLASICREMTCKCGTTELCWRPREVDYDAARAANLTHQMPLKGATCNECRVPRSVRIEQELRDRAKDPCYTNY